MSNNLMDVAYARIECRTPVFGDPDSFTPTYRYVDILIDNECDEIIEPYFFLYDYGQANRTIGYKVPLEGLNYDLVNDNTTSFMGSNIPNHNKVLVYTNSIYFPQLHESEFEGSILTNPTSIDVASGSEDISLGNSMGHVYLILKQYEVSLQLYKRHNNLSDPYNLVDPSLRIPILSQEVELGNSELQLRSIVITLSLDTSNVNYSQAIYGDEVKTPVKWVVSSNKISPLSLPSIDLVNEWLNGKIVVTNNLLYANGLNLGQSVDKYDFDTDPLNDMEIEINGTSVIINGLTLSNDKPF